MSLSVNSILEIKLFARKILIKNDLNGTKFSMKSLLFVSRCPPYPLHFGDRLILWHLARELKAWGYVMDLLAFAQYESDFHELEMYHEFFRDVQVIQEPQRSQLSYLRRVLLPHTRFPREARHSWSPEMWRAIAGKLGVWDYDAIHFFGGIQVYEFYHVLRGQKAIITPYESFSLYLKRQIEQTNRTADRIQRVITRQFERFMYRPYDTTVVVAKPDLQELLDVNPDLNARVISNGIDLDFFKVEPSKREKARLLFTGNYEYQPNLDAAMLLATEILPEVQAAIPDLKLWLVGNAPPPELIALQSDAIEVTGRVPDIRPYLAEATIFVCPLRLGAGIKNKVLEAMAMGLPTIATPLSIDGIAARHNQEVIIAEVSQIAGETIRLLNTVSLQQTLSQNSRALIENRYSWTQVAEAYQSLYDRI